MMPDALRPFVARIAGILVGALSGLLTSKYGFTLTDLDQQSLADGIIVIMSVFFGAYAITHKTVSAKVNPGDAATGTLACQSKAEQAELKP